MYMCSKHYYPRQQSHHSGYLEDCYPSIPELLNRIVPLKSIEYDIGYTLIRSSYTPYSIFHLLKGDYNLANSHSQP